MSDTDTKVDETTVDDTKTGEPSAADLALIDDDLADEGKTDEQLFDEIGAAEAATEAGTAAPEDDAGAAAAEAAKPADDKTGDEETPPEKPSGDKKPDTVAAAEKEDPFADATDEQRAAHDAAQAQIKKLEHSDRSQRGRLSTMQRQINELSQAPPAVPPAADSAAADVKDTGADKGFMTTDEFKSFESEFPEVAGPMRKLVSGMQTQIDGTRKELDAAAVGRHQDLVIEQKALLEEEHEDWEEVIAAPEFGPWLSKEPRHIQDAAVRNAEEIVDAAQAADVIGRFKATRSAQEDTGDDPDAADTADTPAKGEGDGKTTLTGKRKRQLDAASSTRAGGPGAALGIPEDGDPEEIWKAYDRQEKREAQRA